MKTGTYTMTASIYHADPCPVPSLSRSVAWKLVHESPLHAWWEHPRLNALHEESESNRTSLGTLCHTLLLGEGRGIAVYDGSDWRKKEAREFRDAAVSRGETPVTAPQYEQAERIVASARNQLGSMPSVESEVAWLAEEEPGLWLRAMTDWITADGSVVYDYKTIGTSAAPETLHKHAANCAYDFQQAFYERVIAGVRPELAGRLTFRFICQEIEAPYALSVIELLEADVAVARRKVDYAVSRWRECLEANRWPGYGSRPVRVALPTWHSYSWLEREAEEEFA